MSATAAGSRALARIDHFVVLMLENRSFDNVAGWLYGAGNPPPFDRAPRNQPFDGLSGKRLGNPGPGRAAGPAGEAAWVPAARTEDPRSPRHDPGEGYAHTNTQLFGTIRPAGRNCPPWQPPYNLPDAAPLVAPMDGFVRDYVTALRCGGNPAGPADYRQVMACLTPRAVPVLSSLANAYAVCDRWFCSVPAQTWANRSFSLAGTSSGGVDDAPLLQWLGNRAPTVFNRIDEAHRRDLTWRVYFDPAQVLPLTWLILPRLRLYLFHNFRHMDRFYADARAGTLPSVALIEPLMVGRGENDEHPPHGVARGEQLLRDVYRALRRSPCWPRTLFIVTYDEHGGLYDHVPPPRATRPEGGGAAGQYGFRFDRLGVRVCTLLISPYVAQGTVYRARDARGRDVPLDHTAIIRTVCARFGLPGLTLRDQGSPDLGGALALSAPRTDDPPVPAPVLVGAER